MKSVKISGVLLYLFGFVLVLMLYVNYLFLPLSDKVTKLNAEHSADTAQMQSYDNQIIKIVNLKQNIADNKTELANAALNTGTTGKTVSEDIGLALQAAGITLKNIAVGDETADKTKPSADGKSLCSVTVDLHVQCTNAQLLQLLNYFEKQSEGVYYINTVSYNQETDGPVINLMMTLYYFTPVGAKP